MLEVEDAHASECASPGAGQTPAQTRPRASGHNQPRESTLTAPSLGEEICGFNGALQRSPDCGCNNQ